MTADTLKRPLTPAECALVTRYHNLIYRVMKDTNAYTDVSGDLYGDCALALILAAQRYTENEALHKYRFTTIAYKQIRCTIYNHKRHLSKTKEVLSLDAALGACGTLYDVVPDLNALSVEDAALRRLALCVKETMRHKKFRVVNGGLSARREAA